MTRFNMPACPGRRGNRSVVEWVGTVVIHQRAGQRVARWGQSQSPSEQPSRAGRLLCPAVCLPPCLHPVVSSSPHGRPCRLPVLGGEETEAWRAAALWPVAPRASGRLGLGADLLSQPRSPVGAVWAGLVLAGPSQHETVQRQQGGSPPGGGARGSRGRQASRRGARVSG